MFRVLHMGVKLPNSLLDALEQYQKIQRYSAIGAHIPNFCRQSTPTEGSVVSGELSWAWATTSALPCYTSPPVWGVAVLHA